MRPGTQPGARFCYRAPVLPREARVLDALHELVDESETFGVHAPASTDEARLRAMAAAVHEAVASLGERGRAPGPERATLLERVDALVARLGHEHDPARWRSTRAALVDAYDELQRAWEVRTTGRPSSPAGRRHRAKPHNLARTAFHVLSGVMWALVYEHVLDRGPLLWVLGGCLVFFLTDDAMRRWFPERRSGFAVVVFRALSRSSESSGIASSTWYTLGLIVGVALLPKPACMLGLLVLSFADPAAGVVGRRFGKRKLHRDKSVAGTVAFFVVALAIALVSLAIQQPAMALGSRLAVATAVALAGAIAELLGDVVPDNFSVLVVTGTVAALLW